MRRLAILLPALATACAPPIGYERFPVAMACDAARARPLIGQPADEALAARARAAAGAKTVRRITPGMAATTAYRADRLDIEVDDKGLARAIHCG